MKTAPPSKSPLLITAIQLGLLMIIVYYTLIGGQTAQGIFDHRWRLMTQWLSAFILGGWLLWRFFSPKGPIRTPVDGPLLFILISWIMASFFSINSGYSREAFVFFAGYLFFFYLAVDLGRWPWFVELTFNAVIAVAGLVWMLALLQLSWWVQDPTPGPFPRLSVLGNPNTMASFIALVLPLILYKFIAARYRTTRILLGVWVVMLTGAIVLTQSRGGLLGLTVAIAVFGLSLLAQAKRNGGDSRLKASWTWLPRGLHRSWLWSGGLLLGLVSLLLGLPLVTRSLDQAVSDRQQVMVGAIKAGLAHPIFGVGPGALGEALLRYQRPLDRMWSDAHNLPLTLMAETGLIGAIGLGWLAWVGLKMVRQTWPGPATNRDRAGLACLAALLGFLAHNMVDSLFKFPLIMILVALLAGFWLSPHRALTAAPKIWGRLLTAVAFLGLVVTTGIGLSNVRHIKAYNEAVAAATAGDWPLSLATLRQAEALAPELPFYQRQLGVVTGHLAAQEATYLPQAISYYKQALESVTELSIDHANLACLYWENGQRAEAIGAMRQALTLAPNHPIYSLNLGYYLEMEGRLDEAFQIYGQVLITQPKNRQAGFWAHPDERTDRLATFLEGLEGSATNSSGDLIQFAHLHYYAGEPERALSLYEQISPSDLADPTVGRLSKAKALLVLGRLDEAEADLQRVVAMRPEAGEAYLYLSKIALARDNLAAAAENGRLALAWQENGETFYQAGLIAERRGNELEALGHYEAAFSQAVSRFDPTLARYATEVARRRPLPVTYLPCLRQLYPTTLLTDITTAQGALLERRGDEAQAKRVYERVLTYVSQ